MKTTIVIISIIFSGTVSSANVIGDKAEIFGREFKSREYSKWIKDSRALITPETLNLVVQACLRKTQEQMDIPAYALTEHILSTMLSSFNRDSGDRIELSLSRLTSLLKTINDLKANTPSQYSRNCNDSISSYLSDTSAREELAPLFQGRMLPALPTNVPELIRSRLEKMDRKGLRLAPLTWEKLREQICHLEGYYSTSGSPELWKFFSLTRAMSNVLPAPENNGRFIAVIGRNPQLWGLFHRLNTYSSVAGRYNGPSIGMSRRELSEAGVRLTGPAIGSEASSLTALFTTPWREEIQRLVIDQDYPEKPFQLIAAADIVPALATTASDLRPISSSTELGMSTMWNSFYSFRPLEFSDTTIQFKVTSALAWLALNAETNVRQSEKITGYERTSPDFSAITTLIYGSRSEYQLIGRQLAAVRNAYGALPDVASVRPNCLSEAEVLVAAAERGLGDEASVARLGREEVRVLGQVSFSPIIVDIGLEIDDTLGDKPEGIHRLHLATGHGREVTAKVGAEDYLLWTPAAMVLHQNRAWNTAEWRAGGVEQWDKQNH